MVRVVPASGGSNPSMTAPLLPTPVRIANFLGAGARSLGIPLVRLDIDRLIAEAQKKTGLEDLGDPGFREPLERLVDSLEKDAALHILGRTIAKGELARNLEIRLQLVDWHKRHSEIGKLPVNRPIFIMGQGRTGTTILHELLQQDPANRVPQTWEVDAPFPPPERSEYLRDPRIKESQDTLDRAELLIPDFKKIHRMGAELPQECVRMTGVDFLTFIFPAQWRVTSYTRWLAHEANMRPAYANHRRMLQLLQWKCPAERWVLKSPGHLWHLDNVLDEYPDARFVQPHRDPLKILSSLSSLEQVLRAMSSDRVDLGEIAREWSEWNKIAYDRSIDFRESGRVDPSRIIDLQFRDFIADPIAEVRRIYDKFELELSPEVESAMRDYVANNPSDRDGKHNHRFADTGLDLDEERAKVARYQEYFGVESEDTI